MDLYQEWHNTSSISLQETLDAILFVSQSCPLRPSLDTL